MANLECPHCGNALANGVSVCGACGKEMKDDGIAPPSQDQEKEPGKEKLYAILAVLLVLLGGAALLIFTGLLPNPLPGGATIAIVNGEKISAAEVNQKLDTYKKNYGRSNKIDFSSPEGKKNLDNVRKEIVRILIQERIFLTEAARAKITVSPQEIADRVAVIKKGLNLSDSGFRDFLKNSNGMSLSDFEKRIEREYLINKLIETGTKKGLNKQAWVSALIARATVEVMSQ